MDWIDILQRRVRVEVEVSRRHRELPPIHDTLVTDKFSRSENRLSSSGDTLFPYRLVGTMSSPAQLPSSDSANEDTRAQPPPSPPPVTSSSSAQAQPKPIVLLDALDSEYALDPVVTYRLVGAPGGRTTREEPRQRAHLSLLPSSFQTSAQPSELDSHQPAQSDRTLRCRRRLRPI